MILLSACGDSPVDPAAAEPPATVTASSHVTGAVHSLWGRADSGYLPGGRLAFTVRAEVDDEGSRGELVFTAEQARFRGDVTCLWVDGNRAVVTVLITKSTAPDGQAAGVGSHIRFGVVDNGTRRDGAADQIAAPFEFGEDGCGFTPVGSDPFDQLVDFVAGDVTIE
jgi:hypothetical protein